MKRITELKRASFAGLLALLLGVVTTPSANAGELALSNAPLFIELGVSPNVVLTLDDSSSMTNCRITDDGLDVNALIDRDGDYGPLDYAYLGAAAPELNKLAYDPNVEYLPPVDPATGLPLYIPSFTNAAENGYKAAGKESGSTSYLDLSTSWRPCRSRTDWYDPYSPPGDGPGKPAYYAIFTGSNPLDESQVANNSNYKVITVGSLADVSLFDGQLNESNLEKQNFANWFSYYRWRYPVIKTVAARAFAHPDLNKRIRLATSLMWGFDGWCDTTGWPGDCNGSNGGLRNAYDEDYHGPISLMREFAGADRTKFFNWLWSTSTESGTPTKMSMQRAGRYYMDQYLIWDNTYAQDQRYEPMNAVDSPWSFDPGVTRKPVHSCRQAFHILMTDGGASSDTARQGITSNADNQSWTYPVQLPSGATSYSPFAPYKDSDSGELADNAFYFWVNDLQPSIPDDVPAFMPDPTPHPLTNKVEDNPNNDPATWQHMVTYTVGFAVDGDYVNPDDYPALLDGSASWTGDKIDDLWHAAINGRGKYFNTKSPQQMVDAFATALSDVLARSASGSAVALNSGELDAQARLYQALFNSGSWTGQLLSFQLDTVTGAVITPHLWDAAQLLTAKVAGTGWDSNRAIITYDGTSGLPFRWSSLPTAMRSEIEAPIAGVTPKRGQDKIRYLRGDESDEGINGLKFRARATKLGDIVDSSPVFVGDPGFDHPDALESQPYSSFRSSMSGRPAMLYTGANDGMLHGFDANTGEERIAYVPREVFPNLHRLLVPAYAHTFFVNGTPTVGDVFYSGAWHTVLAGGLRKGGQAIYALDVTDPLSFSEANASALALWEFSDVNDADLGYTYSRPAIVRLHNGRWAAVFGNGYNNTVADGNASLTGNAVLFIVDIENGSVIKKLDTGVGMAQDPTVTLTPNGLATVSPVDVDGDRIADYVYGGDLFGNLWKFDVTDADPANWGIAYGGTPLFVAKDDSGTPQPITAQVEAGPHPSTTSGGAFNDGGYMVYFGTGKYLESADNAILGQQTQTLYGIWDPNLASKPPYSRGKLLEQQILREDMVTVNGVDAEVRVTTDNTIAWPSNPLLPGTKKLGWYMDLLNTEGGNTNNKGERQVTTPILRDGRIIFTTLIPSGSSCVFGGDGWLMEIDAASGSRLADAPFDIDGDGAFDLVSDGSGNFVAPGGLKSQVGAPQTPGILSTPGDVEYKYVGGTEGGTQVISEQAPKQPPGKGSREAWRQMR